ncbi:M61 family metallopeptidase [Solilutibacter silvestris]|uniref:M61 family metallopeptidase n=1 Tax=Solilutibacter silvestris TaxID=1645665 RepID=UPI003D349F8C
MLRRSLPALAILPLALASALASAQTVPEPKDVDFPGGPVTIEVDATDLSQRIFKVKEVIPASQGTLTLLYSQWIPGQHSPSGPIDKMAGFVFTANGKRLTWKRDPANVYAFHVEVPAGVSSVTAEYQYLSPTTSAEGGAQMTPKLLNLKWNTVLLYPAGYYGARIPFVAKVRYPTGWTAFTALDVASKAGDVVTYKQEPFDILVDSPVFAGRYAKDYDLTPEGSKVPVHLSVVADAPDMLVAKPKHLDQHKELVRQALKLYGAQHYDHYNLLFSLSDQLTGNGLEHQRSSENGVDTGYFKDWNEKDGSYDLLPHEYTHSWNGKYRRGADLWVPNLNTPMQDSLLWVYEGQTQYWGNVLAARSGLRPLDRSRDTLAMVVATYQDNRPGLQWRSVQDTTNDPTIAQRRPKPYRGYQMSEDYYSAGQLIWLGADAIIRQKTNNQKSLDDFAKAFFGVNDGEWRKQNTYKFEDVVATLNGVVPYDWASYLRDRLDGRVPFANTIESTGWKLVYKDEPNAAAKAGGRRGGGGGGDFVYSIGLALDKDGKVGEARWDSPAFNAGIGTGNTIVAVNDVEYSKDALSDAIKAAKADKAPIRLLVKDFNQYRNVSLDYHDGLRYPALERIPNTQDYLTDIFSPKK